MHRPPVVPSSPACTTRRPPRALAGLLVLLATCALPLSARDEPRAAAPRVLFLTHSAGFEHEVVRRPSPEGLSLAEQALVAAAGDTFAVHATKDCSALTAEGLAGYDAVVFFTSGELSAPDGAPAALQQWVAKGGAFVSVHSGTDTWHGRPHYAALVGGAFVDHPWHEEVDVLVEQPGHPSARHLPGRWTLTDEIYRHAGFRRHPSAVVLSLAGSSVDLSPAGGQRDVPLAWWRDHGQGRVFVTALGHRPELWTDERFVQHVLGGLQWALHGPDLPRPPPLRATRLVGPRTDGSASAAAFDAAPHWRHRDGGPLAWQDIDGALQVVAGTGDLVSTATFGDALVHVEFRTPRAPDGAIGQARGNSGVYLHGRYEVQVLDSFGVEEPGRGDCGAIYATAAPATNASRPPERWQSYDIRFTAPRFDAQGSKTADARVSVWHNGLLVQDDVPVPAPTGGQLDDAEAPTGPLLLQDHGDPVRFRNVWIAPLDA